MSRISTFAEFWHLSTGWNGRDYSGPRKLIPACGSDSVYHLDGRHALRNRIAEAREVARKRGFPAFRIMRAGNPGTYTNARPESDLVTLPATDTTPPPQAENAPRAAVF